MTRILLIVDPETQSSYIIEDPRSPRDLAIAINTGRLKIGEEVLADKEGRQWAIPMSTIETVAIVLQPPPVQLTPRQYQVLFSLSDGLLTKEIAADMGISRRMVYEYYAALRQAFNKDTLREMLATAFEAGYVEDLPI